MAINPLISLQAQAPDIGGTFSNVLLSLGRIEDIKRGRAEAPARQRLLEAQAGAAEAAVPTEQQLANKAQRDRLQSIVTGAVQLNTLPTTEGKLNFLRNRRTQLIEQSKATDRPVNTEETDLIISKLEAGDEGGAQQLIDSTIRAGQQLGMVGELRADIQKAGKEGVVDEVQSSKILPSGVTHIVRKSGKVETMEPTPEEAEIIRKAEERGVDLQQRRAQGRVLGKDAATIANKAFQQTGKIRANNISLRKVIAEVRGGAETGPLISRLPSIRAASVRLDTLKNQLGLDVVSSVTFGALSERELRTAMSTALPTGLEGPELVKWAEEKISAQEKLSDYLEGQAIFLSKPGNTGADWLIKVRTEGSARPEQPQQQQATQPIRFNRQGQRVE